MQLLKVNTRPSCFSKNVDLFLAGFFSRKSVNSKAENGALFSNEIQMLHQLLGIVVAIAWPLVWTLLLIKFIHLTVSLSTFL